MFSYVFLNFNAECVLYSLFLFFFFVWYAHVDSVLAGCADAVGTLGSLLGLDRQRPQLAAGAGTSLGGSAAGSGLS